ncbi:MAG: L-2-hydroxyglutarate oxidase [Flavobacteriales bacterium]|nr:L-2-hydroxyglutarate oxidase [Flavobacteriales bacterium]
MDKLYDIAIVGGGIVGAATAYKLQTAYPEMKLLLLEKESHFAPHQTGNNSGVIHSGMYYTPGSKKAVNCVNGRREIVQFAKEHNVAHEVCGKVVVATEEKELQFMEKIYNNGLANKIEGIEKITGDQIKEIEPFVESIGGLWVPCTGIIDFVEMTNRMIEITKGINVESDLLTGREVTSFERDGYIRNIITSKGKYKAKRMIFCGGLHADRLAKKDQVDLKEKVVGFRGDYYDLTEQGKEKVRNLIYPVPNPDFPFLGVHFTRMTNGEIECGPNAVFTFKREGYGKFDFSLRDTIDALSYSGTWKLLLNNTKFAIDEYRRAFSKKLFLQTLQRMIPSLTMDDIKPGRAGVRAQLLGTGGETRDDFRIEYTKDSIHVLNAPSPAATACLAIGGDIRDMAEKHFNLQ